MWTAFYDNLQDGISKTNYHHIYIETTKENAIQVFATRFGFSPFEKNAFTLETHTDLSQLTAYDRGCEYLLFDREGNGHYIEQPRGSGGTPYFSLEQFLRQEHILVISIDMIVPDDFPDFALLSLASEFILDEALRKREIQLLHQHIDESLRNKDKSQFLLWTERLKNLSN